MRKRFTLNQLKTLALFRLFDCPLNAVMIANLKMRVYMSHKEDYEKNIAEDLEKLRQIGAVEEMHMITPLRDVFIYYRITEGGVHLMKRRIEDTMERATQSFESSIDLMRIYLWLYPEAVGNHLLQRRRLQLDNYSRSFADQIFQDKEKLWEALKESRRTDAKEKLSLSLRVLRENGYSVEPVKDIWPSQTGKWAKDTMDIKCLAEKTQLDHMLGRHAGSGAHR